MAFISSFHGTTKLGHETSLLQTTSRRPTMKFGSDKMLEKYDKMSREVPTMSSSSKPSSVWSAYAKGMLDKFAPTRSQVFAGKGAGTYEDMMTQLALRASRPFIPGGAPTTSAADSYMADCVTRQYKAMACANGIFGVSCTEGTTRGAAEDSRTLALGAAFRMGQRSSNAKFADFYTNRKYATSACHACSYEEALVGNYQKVATAMITGLSEAKGACVRYVAASDPVEKYMADCVDKQNKYRAVASGEYGVMCQDGAAKGLSEFKRVAGLAARFRAAQASPITLEDRKFAVRKWARENFAGQCGYEEALFNAYPAVSMAMRIESIRY